MNGSIPWKSSTCTGNLTTSVPSYRFSYLVNISQYLNLVSFANIANIVNILNRIRICPHVQKGTPCAPVLCLLRVIQTETPCHQPCARLDRIDIRCGIPLCRHSFYCQQQARLTGTTTALCKPIEVTLTIIPSINVIIVTINFIPTINLNS